MTPTAQKALARLLGPQWPYRRATFETFLGSHKQFDLWYAAIIDTHWITVVAEEDSYPCQLEYMSELEREPADIHRALRRGAKIAKERGLIP